MILVTGATGHFGKATIDFLIKKGIPASNISALVRDEAKAGELKSQGVRVKVGDYDDSHSLLEAFRGVDKLLLVSGTDIVERSKQQEKVVNAARQAGVKHIAYTSFDRKNETETSPIALVAKAHLDTERQIKSSGMSYTIFRNNLYADMIPMFLGEQVATTGVFFPAGEGKTAFATRSDMAEAAAQVLATEGHENKEYVLANTESVSFADIAEILTGIFGKDIAYVNPSTEAFTDALTQAGVPAEIIGISVAFAEAMKQGEFAATSADLEKLLGRKPTSVKEYLAGVYAAK
jgi:NAD(P)H dehydrogenase (quinone)